MDVRSGRYYIDSLDAWEAFGLIITEGINEFMKIPDKKDSITHDWADKDGIDVDLSGVYFKEKDITLQVVILATGEADYWDKYEKFVNQLKKPGTRRVEVTELSRSFSVFYKSCTSFSMLSRIKNENKVAAKATLVFTQKDPGLDNKNIYLTDEDGRFFIT